MEEAAIGVHGAAVQDCVQRRLDLVLERKAIPSDLAMRVLEHTCVEATEHVWRVELRVRAANRSFEIRGQVVAVQADRRFRQPWPGGLDISSLLQPTLVRPSRARQSRPRRASGTL